VRANCLCPGDTFVERWATEGYFSSVAGGGGGGGAVSLQQADADAVAADVPLRRVATVDEIARAAVFLCSDDSSFMTGQPLVIDGGNTAR
jgi:3alpha(or 20beta)-hydroxysteroid dehydrogenase